MNLTLITEKQKMNYLNYINAPWDCFGFHITQVGNIPPGAIYCRIKQNCLTWQSARNDYAAIIIIVMLFDYMICVKGYPSVFSLKHPIKLESLILEIMLCGCAKRSSKNKY